MIETHPTSLGHRVIRVNEKRGILHALVGPWPQHGRRSKPHAIIRSENPGITNGPGRPLGMAGNEQLPLVFNRADSLGSPVR